MNAVQAATQVWYEVINKSTNEQITHSSNKVGSVTDENIRAFIDGEYHIKEVRPYNSSGSLSGYEIIQSILNASDQELPNLIRQAMEYSWFSPHRKKRALENMEGLLLAYECQLPIQITLHKTMLIRRLREDLAHHFYSLAQTHLKYGGSIEVIEYGNHNSQAFRFTDSWGGEWMFYPINQFQKQIPSHALKPILMFRQEKLAPDGYWVADKVQKIQIATTPKSLDPILCAQFGEWFAGIAMWL